jgi:hypothetical protein
MVAHHPSDGGKLKREGLGSGKRAKPYLQKKKTRAGGVA